MEEEAKRRRIVGLDSQRSSDCDDLDGSSTVASAAALGVETENDSKVQRRGQSGLCSICQCDESSRLYILNTGARVLVALAAGFIPRGLNYVGMRAYAACYKALTSSHSNKWPSGSLRNSLLVDCETLVLRSPPLTGAATVQLSVGLVLRTSLRRLRDEHAEDGVSALDGSLMSLDRIDRSGLWCLLPGVPGSNVSLSNRLILRSDKSP